MIQTLYDCFKHWSDGGSIYVYSDFHFDDGDCKLMDPNWISPQEQVDIINKMVHKSDTLILLGDVGNVEWVKKLKAGHKVLITGNHDCGAGKYKTKLKTVAVFDAENDAIDAYINNQIECWKRDNDSQIVYGYIKECLFDEVYTGPLMISDKIILSHEPIPNITWALNIHGHDHGGRETDIYHYNVCSNVIGYTPVKLDKVIKSGVLNKIVSLHRQTINHASANGYDFER